MGSKKIFRLFFLALIILSFGAQRAQAEEYAAPTWTNLLRTMIRLGALDLSDTSMIDEYAIISECKLYDSFYQDDFKWQKVRDAIRESVQMNLATFPVAYRYDVKMQLDRYDFDAKIFRFVKGTILKGVNTIELHMGKLFPCGVKELFFVPKAFRAVLPNGVPLEGIPLSERDANDLLKRLGKGPDARRIVYTRYKLRVLNIDPYVKQESGSDPQGDTLYKYKQTIQDKQGDEEGRVVRVDVRLDSISFYEDANLTKLIYEYKPSQG